MATITIVEKNTVKIEDFNGSFIGERIQGIADITLDDYYNGVGITLTATELGLDGLIAIFIQSSDVNIGINNGVFFDWIASRGVLWAFSNGSECADGDLDGLHARIMFIGY